MLHPTRSVPIIATLCGVMPGERYALLMGKTLRIFGLIALAFGALFWWLDAPKIVLAALLITSLALLAVSIFVSMGAKGRSEYRSLVRASFRASKCPDCDAGKMRHWAYCGDEVCNTRLELSETRS